MYAGYPRCDPAGGRVHVPGGISLSKTSVLACGAAAVLGIALAPAAASASTLSTPTPTSSATPAAGSDPDAATTVTFAVTIGVLAITAPGTADLGPGDPGTDITGTLGGPVVVTDTRAAVDASWTATAASTDFTTGGATTAETIPATDVDYDPGTITTTGDITATGTAITLANAAQTVVATTGVGNNTASWDPTLTVHVPAAAVGGPYTGTLTDSVS